MSRISFFPRQSRLARAVRSALAMLALGAAASVWAAGAAEPAASAAGGPAPLTVTVQPGQSLNDIAIAATQSRDPGVLARAGRALFDANPQAFMKRDPSRLKVGATLTVPALDANGSALAPAGASAASGATPASAGVAASGGAALAQHGASASRAASAAQSAPGAAAAVAASSASAASAARPTPTSGASSSTAAVAAAASAASAAHGSAPLESTQPATPVAGASGPHVWSGTIQSAPSSASGAAVAPSSGAPVSGAREPAGAAPGNGASQPRPSSLQQLLALKNRVLMELQKHGIGKPAATNGTAPTTATAPAAPRAAANDATPASTAVQASDAASAVGASATQPASASARPAAPVAPASTNRTTQIDWRPTAVAGSAALVLAIWFALRRRRKAAAAAGSPADAPTDGPAEADANADDATAAPRPIGSESPILPETPVARDVISNVSVAAAAETAAEAVQPRGTDDDARSAAVRKDEPVEAPLDAAATHPSETTAEPTTEPASPATGIAGDTPADTPAAPTTDTQHAALMQNAISALNSLDMPLPPRASEDASSTDASTSEEHPSNDPSSATNGQSAPRPPVDVADSASEHRADHDDELEWDPDAAAPVARASAPSTTSSLPPLGGAQFGALKLDFDLDLPSAPGAVLPALTPDELARIARNKLDLAAEYVELGDLSGARTLLQEVVDANDAATRDDARAMLAKLADA
ncbi:pilus assembly protein FimV [Burkholderia dolosa]|uniref:FimV/HubP family polar landmark protein n=1 Tax=Burkholderia dolosa TaxID=152500 RepID=UPI001B967D01|nr:FimV/HubP family polar landmark protein [Burkholderia dolosa]MBR8302717.1 pilus assembly protein FimV [Burkholderia dolosa]